LDGYGQECFLAKDERGQEVLIGASISGDFLNFLAISSLNLCSGSHSELFQLCEKPHEILLKEKNPQS